MANIVSRFFDRVTGTAEKEEKLKRQEERMQREMRPLQQKASARNAVKFQSGQISKPQYEKQMGVIARNGSPLRPQDTVHEYHDTRLTPMAVLRDVFDSNTAIDIQNRVLNGQPALYRDQQIALGNTRPYESLGAQLVGNTGRFLNTGAYAINAGLETGRGQIADWTNNEEAFKASLDRQRYLREIGGDTQGGLLNTGTIYNNAEEAANLGNAEIAKRVGLNTLGTASEVVPFARVARPVVVGGKATTQLVKGTRPLAVGSKGSRLIQTASNAERGVAGLKARAGFNAAIDSTTGAGESVARQYAQTGSVDPGTLVGDVVGNVAFGQTQLVPAYTRALANSDTAVKTQAKTKSPASSSEIVKSDATYKKLEKRISETLERVGDSTGKLKENYKQEARELIRQRNARVAELTQGGYVKNPFSKDEIPERYIKEYADILQSMDDGAKGGQMIPDGQGGYKRMSEHSKFYSDYYKANKRKPSRKAYMEHAKEEIKNDSGFMEYVEKDRQQPKPIANKPSPRMSKEERLSLYESVPQGTERPIKVTKPNSAKNIAVSKVSQDGDLVTKTNVNPNIKVREKTYSLDSNGELIEDSKGAYKLFTDDEGKIKGFRVGNEYIDAKDLGDLSDVNNYGSTFATMRRNVERSFGKQTGEKVNKFLVDHQQKAATKLINRQVELNNGMRKVQEDLGIKFYGAGKSKGKRVSADIQNFGEKRMTRAQLDAKYGKEYAQKIVNADKWFRKQYDSLLNEMNQTLTQYGYDPVPKRKNYYTHFQEPKLWERFGLKMQEIRNLSNPTMQDATPDKARGSIPNKLAGESEYLQPNKRFNPFAMQRRGDQATADAFQAFDRYMSPTLNNIYMTPSITRARVLSKAIAQDSDLAGKDATGVIIQMKEWANHLAGKSNRIGDRQLSDSNWGRKYLSAANWAQKKAGQNSIIGNLSTAVLQPVVLTQTAGKFGFKNTILGAMQEMSTAHAKDAPIRQSEFMRRRYADTSSVIKSGGDRAREIANTPLEVVEETTARITWNSAYNDAVSQGLKGTEAVKYADVQAEKTLAGRSIGERPELFRSKAAGPATMFQLEVNNFWQQFGKEMNTTQKAKTMVAAYAFGLLMQQVIGRDVGFNPVDALIDSVGIALDDSEDEEGNPKGIGEKAIRVGQRLGGEVFDNTPVVPALTTALIGDKNVKKIFGPESDAGRFGVASPISTLVTNPQNLVLPFGGSQIKKTYQGAQAWLNGGMDNKDGDRTVDVAQTPQNLARATLFGKSSIPEVNQYYDNIGKKKQDQKEVINQTSNSQASKQGKPRATGQVAITDSTQKDDKGEYISRDKYDAIINAYETNDKTLDDGTITTKGNIGKYDSDELKQAIKDVSTEGKKVFEDAGLPFFDDMKADSKFARDYASFRNSIKDVDEITKQKKTQSFIKDTYKSQYLGDGKLKSFYTLSDDDMRYELQQGTLNQEEMDKIIALDNLLTSEGLQPYMQVGKTLRRELGYGVVDSGTGKSSYAGRAKSKSGSKGKKTALKLDLTDYINKSKVPTTQNRYTASRPRGATYRPVQLRSYSANSGTIPTAPRISVRRAIA